MTTIINPLPNTIANGQPGDATKVQQNFQWIVDQVNSNITPTGSGTDFGSSTLGSCQITALSTPVICNTGGGTIVNDTLNEWTGALGRFTPMNAGTYQVSYDGSFGINGTNIVTGSVFQLGLYKNGVAQNPGFLTSYPFSGGGTFNLPLNVSAMIVLAAGDHVDFRVVLTGSTFSSGTVFYFGLVAVRRVA